MEWSSFHFFVLVLLLVKVDLVFIVVLATDAERPRTGCWGLHLINLHHRGRLPQHEVLQVRPWRGVSHCFLDLLQLLFCHHLGFLQGVLVLASLLRGRLLVAWVLERRGRLALVAREVCCLLMLQSYLLSVVALDRPVLRVVHLRLGLVLGCLELLTEV